MTLFVYNYEAAVLQFLQNALSPLQFVVNQDAREVPLNLTPIREATYSPEENLISAMSNIKYFPYLIFSREESSHEWARPASFTVQHHDGKVDILRIYQFQQIYHGYIYVESAAQAFAVEMLLRDYWQSHHKVQVYAPEVTCSDQGGTKPYLPVQLRLLYIKPSDKRLANNVVGSLRCVEFSWQSVLFTTNIPGASTSALVEEVALHIDGGGATLSFDGTGFNLGSYSIKLTT